MGDKDTGSSPRTGFKTPAKTIKVTAESSTIDDQDTAKDTSVLIPTKSSPVAPLGPLSGNAGFENPQIIVQKKRKLQLTADPDEVEQSATKIIPSKSRSSSVVSQRIPSLNDISKPELTPPKLNLSYQSFEEQSPAADIIKTSSPKKTTTLEKQSEDQDVIESPIRPTKSNLELRREESKLDYELRQARKKVETLKRAKVILSKNDTDKNQKLIDKWRDAAQRASNYLLNAAIEKINKAGGKKEYEKRERERNNERLEYSLDNSFQDRISDITNSEEYDALPEKEKERILEELENEAEKSMREFENEIQEKEKEYEDQDDDEFTMKDLYKKLNLDYDLVYSGDE
ncbi:Laminin subunit beta-2 [Wickerhamomyces ciferrii]|uniref:Laminin subunit beta-2 n=1 Tax=Wickerhamomyces ciferrii (strain ATCC 14091 / BCRC 22168 / CBS 111 / JCM 3599 / NBRC 0793 / NRRL Y-1031 F-60-10) TaxID=1206466 RepID=K0KFF2_WICCF|nr:Laminin subunit beta-2 [Wickerhamomyces ciferrii]CCH43850.1 Laminin subunit beta-2 [Wickerhamomyces ciferrii]